MKEIKMNIKQKLMGFGLAALLNSCDNSNISHFTYGGKVLDIDSSEEYLGVALENEKTNSVAYAEIRRNEITEDFRNKLERGTLRLQDCDAEITTKDGETTFYHLKNCRFYR